MRTCLSVLCSSEAERRQNDMCPVSALGPTRGTALVSFRPPHSSPPCPSYSAPCLPSHSDFQLLLCGASAAYLFTQMLLG